MSVRKSAGKSGFTTLGITTVICFIIFTFMTKNPTYKLEDMPLDIALTGMLTGLITALLMSLTSKGAVKKGTAPILPSLDDQACYLLVPENIFGYIIAMTVLCLWLFGLAPLGLIYVFFPDIVMARFVYVFFKALVAGCAAGFAAYHANLMLYYLLNKKMTPIGANE